MNNKFIPETEFRFLPKFVKQKSDMEYGSIVTHENYNEKLNLNTDQGDYNTEVLRLLLTQSNPESTFHISYLDNAINTLVNKYDNDLDSIKSDIVDIKDAADILSNTVNDGFNTTNTVINNIINGTTQVANAYAADSIKDVELASSHSYYGTDYDGNVGFHKVPDAIFCEEMDSKEIEVGTVYFKPQVNSVEESMLTPDVRNKLNREVITSYNGLADRPSINNKVLIDNMSLAELGIQPAGEYLTSVPSEYITETALDAYTNNTLVPLFVNNTTYNTFKTETESNISTINNSYPRVFINTVPSSIAPRDGDILVIL